MKHQQQAHNEVNDNNNDNHNNKGNNTMMMPDGGDFDIDGLCEEMKAKARCSETGRWFSKEEMKDKMAMMGKTTMPTCF